MSSYQDLLRLARSTVVETSIDEVDTRAPEVVLLDVREPMEFATGIIEGSVLLPLGQIEEVETVLVDKDAPVVAYCAHANRSAVAALIMTEMGYKQVTSMADGIEEWKARGKPVALPDNSV